MATQVQRRRGSAQDYIDSGFIGAEGEFTYDKTAKTIRVHDGSTPGGFKLVRQGVGVEAQETPVFRKISYDEQGLITSAAVVQFTDLQSILTGNVVFANAAITPGTGCKISFDSKGLVTSATTLSASDIPALTISKITDLQDALDAKMDLIAVSSDDDAQGTINLVDGAVKSITLGSAVTLVPPVVSDTTVLHQCMVQLKNPSNYSVSISSATMNFGTSVLSPASTLSSTGTYNVYFEYDVNEQRWVVGIITKTAQQS